MAAVSKMVRNLFRLRNESGTAAIEFALFSLPLLCLLTATVELGLLMYEAMQVNNAVEAGLLYAAKNGFKFHSHYHRRCRRRHHLRDRRAEPDRHPRAVAVLRCPSATGITNSGTCVNPPACADGSTLGTYVKVNASLAHVSVLPGATTLFSNLPATLTATAVVRIN